MALISALLASVFVVVIIVVVIVFVVVVIIVVVVAAAVSHLTIEATKKMLGRLNEGLQRFVRGCCAP